MNCVVEAIRSVKQHNGYDSDVLLRNANIPSSPCCRTERACRILLYRVLLLCAETSKLTHCRAQFPRLYKFDEGLHDDGTHPDVLVLLTLGR